MSVEKTTTGFSAYAEKYSAFTTGRTVEELMANMVESLNLFCEAERQGQSNYPWRPSFSGKKKPSSKQPEKIIEGIRDIGGELTELQLVTH